MKFPGQVQDRSEMPEPAAGNGPHPQAGSAGGWQELVELAAYAKAVDVVADALSTWAHD